MYIKIFVFTLIFIFNLNSVSAVLFIKNNTKYNIGVYIDSSIIIRKESDDQKGDILYCILESEKEEFIKLEKTIIEIKNEKIIYNKNEDKIVCDFTNGKIFTLEFTIIDHFDEFETEIKVPVYNDKNQITRYKIEKIKLKKPIYKTISKSEQIIDNSKYNVTYDEKTKELEINRQN